MGEAAELVFSIVAVDVAVAVVRLSAKALSSSRVFQRNKSSPNSAVSIVKGLAV